MNKKAIENAVFVIILFVALIGMGLTLWSLQMPVSPPIAYVAAPIQLQAPCQIDCDDGEAGVNPGAQEVCDDLIDNNCNGEVDEGCCGNGVQDPGEQCDPPGSRCKQGGNEGICTAADTAQPCSCNTALCQHCGDGICAFDENAQSCNQDCDPVCGNLACEASEGNTCQDDCQSNCGNGACETGQFIPNENAINCPNDCGTNNNQCAGNALCQFNRFVYDPGDEGGFINCVVDCCSAACETDSDCAPNANYPCISGTCNTNEGFCEFSEIEGCCEENADCDDQNPCTDDACSESECTNTPNTDPCADDSNPCTDDVCSQGDCTHPNNNANACTDGDSCTDDVCDDGECASTPKNCDDQNECTLDSCDDGECFNLNICCETNGDCDDTDACTTDTCQDGTCNFAPKICFDENVCTIDTCDSVLGCQFTPVNCDDENPCTVDTCNPFQQVPGSIIPQNGFDCTHVFSSQLCPPRSGGGGGGGAAAGCRSHVDFNPQLHKPVGWQCVTDSDCQRTAKKLGQNPSDYLCTVTERRQGAGAIQNTCSCSKIEVSEPAPQAPASVPFSNLPPREERPPQSAPEQGELPAPPAPPLLEGPRQPARDIYRVPLEGAVTQQSKPSVSPAVWAVMLLIGLLLGIWIYFNKDAFIKKEQKAEQTISDTFKEIEKMAGKKRRSKRR